VPSEFSPADRADREDRLYDVEAMVENIGEDPARWLDRNLEHHGVPQLKEREFSAWDEPNYRLVPEEDVSKPLSMVKGRIDGIDSIAVARAWQAVERRLRSTPEGGRDVIIDHLDERIEQLEEEGRAGTARALSGGAAPARRRGPTRPPTKATPSSSDPTASRPLAPRARVLSRNSPRWPTGVRSRCPSTTIC